MKKRTVERKTGNGGARRAFPFAAGASAAVAVLAGALAILFASQTSAAPLTAPVNTGEPSITGTPMAGEILRATTGTWTGTGTLTYAFRWLRCDASGSRADGSDCTPISQATRRTYEVRRADVGFRLRVRVTASNADGSSSAASNATAIVASAVPVNTDRPSISGSPVLGNQLQANRGTWAGFQPITYRFRWLRCSSQGDNCGEIAGATDNSYVVASADVGRTLRVRVTARNDRGSSSALSLPTGVVQAKPNPSPGSTVQVKDVPSTARFIVSQVRFSPNPVTSRSAPITVRIRVTDTRGYVIQGALVFIRSTPRVTSGGDRQATGADGWVSYQLVPNANFRVRTGYNVQFFVKAYRAGDPALAGIAGYRLVQVPHGEPLTAFPCDTGGGAARRLPWTGSRHNREASLVPPPGCTHRLRSRLAAAQTRARRRSRLATVGRARFGVTRAHDEPFGADRR